MSAIEFTSEQLQEGIANAIAARDFQAAIDMLTVLVRVDMDAAISVHEQIQLGLALNRQATR